MDVGSIPSIPISNFSESEGVLMVILYGIFGCVDMIIFQLTERIAIVTKSSEAVYEGLLKDILAFSYLAIPTRHEVTCKPSAYMKIKTHSTKLSSITHSAKQFNGVSPNGKAQGFGSCMCWFESNYPSYSKDRDVHSTSGKP